MKLFLFILTLLFIAPVWAQKSKAKTEVIPPVAVSEGITYALPRTAILIKVKAVQTTYVAGPFAAFADPLLGIKEALNQPATSWVIRDISFTTFSEPDPAKIFKTGNMTVPLLQLTPEGILAGFNSDRQTYASSFGVSNSFASGTGSFPVLFTNSVLQSASSGRTAPAQRAEEAAAVILKARAARNEIVAGMLDEYHPDGKAYEESLDELRLTEKETLELFTGKSQSREYTFSYVYLPSGKSVKGEVVFRFDESLGFLAKNDFSGKPVMIDVEAEEMPVPVSSDAALQPSGLYYRQPGLANVRLYKELSLVGSARLPVAQFGNVLSVSAELLSGAYILDFSPETGALTGVRKK